ncbi:MAG TPA: aldo/keto reductase [Rhodospirillaceae bacterium]|nr:aldo/keto reductase [Rhodospirillaceae bacterium]HAA90948.1 aldo/keto reductase [Rhodospirillaceae bacterium]HAT34569.1 aldo/keto reductase [Rhodospirillaceae bacterium]
MEFTTLGNTGLKVSVAGLGTGGNSRLGRKTGRSTAESVDIIHQAVGLGINFIDTAANYGTEPFVGEALKTIQRDSVVIATKDHISDKDGLWTAERVVENFEAALGRLNTDYVDVFNLHGVKPHEYDYALAEIAPALIREKEKGKIRHIGITEAATSDPDHTMLNRATQEGVWEVCMVAFHMMCQNARTQVFPHSQENGVGTLLMYAVRSIFSNQDYLKETLAELAEAGEISAELAEGEPLDFLMTEGGAKNVIDAAYRFVRHEPGTDILLFGTGNPEHLKSNLESILSPPLPTETTQKLYDLFGALNGVGLDLPKFKQ